MLARGILCRLAADVPKTSTHDLPQLARQLQRSVLSRNALSVPVLCAISRAYKSALAVSRRSYATTTTRATKPTKTVKKAVKKAAAKKPPAKRVAAKKPAAKKSAAKKPRKSTATTKKTAKPKKKPVAKPKRVKLTPEQKQKSLIRGFRVKALREPVRYNGVTAMNVFLAEATRGGKQSLTDVSKQFSTLNAAEREHYNHIANEQTAARKKAYGAWVHSHTPDQIRIANNARKRLRALLPAGKRRKTPAHTAPIKDDRHVKRPKTGYIVFVTERRTSGDFKGISNIEAFKLIANEWKALSASEKKKFEDAAATGRVEYQREYERTYGHKP